MRPGTPQDIPSHAELLGLLSFSHRPRVEYYNFLTCDHTKVAYQTNGRTLTRNKIRLPVQRVYSRSLWPIHACVRNGTQVPVAGEEIRAGTRILAGPTTQEGAPVVDLQNTPNRLDGIPRSALHALAGRPAGLCPALQGCHPRRVARSQGDPLYQPRSSQPLSLGRGQACTEHTSETSASRGKSSARSCRALHDCAAGFSARFARRYSRIKRLSGLRPRSDARCGRRLTRFLASASRPHARSLSSSI